MHASPKANQMWLTNKPNIRKVARQVLFNKNTHQPPRVMATLNTLVSNKTPHPKYQRVPEKVTQTLPILIPNAKLAGIDTNPQSTTLYIVTHMKDVLF